MPTASPLPSFSSGRFRVLEIGLLFTQQNPKKDAKNVYAKLWITTPERKLKSNLVNVRKGINSSEWEGRFVFSISENFLSRVDCTLLFLEIYRTRKFLHDSLIGLAQCDLKSLFKECEYGEKEVVYHHQYSEYDIMYDESFNLADDDEIVEEEQYYELPELKASTSVRLSDASDSFKGTLSLDAVVWKGYIASVGDLKWRNVAMTYDNFMGLQSNNAKETRNKNWLCCANTTSVR